MIINVENERAVFKNLNDQEFDTVLSLFEKDRVFSPKRGVLEVYSTPPRYWKNLVVLSRSYDITIV